MQAVLLILTPLFPALCALLCWFVPALRPDKARDRFVLASLVASFLLTVALCLTGDGSLTLLPSPRTCRWWRPPTACRGCSAS